MNINKDVLYGMLEKKVRSFMLHRGNDLAAADDFLLWLAHTIIFNNPADNCIIKGNGELFRHLPPHKSLFHAPLNAGLPVGNLTSQFFANVYLNELDQYVKHTLKCKYYVRYCDDFLLLDESPERLQEVRHLVETFLQERLCLVLNEKFKNVLPVSNGIDFLGYIIRPDYTLVRRRVVNNLRTRLNKFEKTLTGRRKISSTAAASIFKYDRDCLQQLRSMLASYWGHLQWADTYQLKQAIIRRYSFLKEYFYQGNPLQPCYRYPALFRSVRAQYEYYANRFSGAVIFFQVGCFYEFYKKSRGPLLLGLKELKGKRGTQYGIPVRLGAEYARKLLDKGIPVVVVKETSITRDKLKERIPFMKLIPDSRGGCQNA